jgi:hypothetical protein
VQAQRLPEKFIILRHDVDLDANCQLKNAELEHRYGIHASYYFRFIEKVFKEDIIDKVARLGHEVGYHYEVFTKARGNAEEALRLFRKEQDVFRVRWNSLTVCPHGGSFMEGADAIKLIPRLLAGKPVISHQVNFNMWEENNFVDFGIIGDAYRSIDFSDILYLSDTGRSWDPRYKRLDRVASGVNANYTLRSSDDIIDVIKSGKANKIYLLVHFEQWKDNIKEWLAWYASQLLRRTGKRVLLGEKRLPIEKK